MSHLEYESICIILGLKNPHTDFIYFLTVCQIKNPLKTTQFYPNYYIYLT